MFSLIKKIGNKFFRKATNVEHGSVNKVSLVIIILIDIFVLFNVFTGLNSISEWILSPAEEFPCLPAYTNYQTSEKKGSFDFNAATIENLIEERKLSRSPVLDNSNRWGKVSSLCADHSRLAKGIDTPQLKQLKAGIDRLRTEISVRDREISTLRSQYNSTLLEKIAGQPSQQSINKVTADRIKSEIDRNQNEIATRKKQITDNQTKLIQHPSADAYLKLLNNTSEYEVIKKAYDSSRFWYPNKQLLLQALFLLPLIGIAYLWHRSAIAKNQGLPALISWHLLVIFCLPLLIKVFQFLQFGNLVQIGIEFIASILGGLIFVASYLYIILIPLVGLGLIKILQSLVFNPRVQAKKRIQKVRCINCNSKLRLSDQFCPYCGLEQYLDCSNCHQKTYKFTNFCSSCGHQISAERE